MVFFNDCLYWDEIESQCSFDLHFFDGAFLVVKMNIFKMFSVILSFENVLISLSRLLIELFDFFFSFLSPCVFLILIYIKNTSYKIFPLTLYAVSSLEYFLY